LLPTAEIVVVVQFTALKRFIRREHLPADASRGCLIPGVLAALTLHNNTFTNSSPLFQRTLLSESALLTMPIPDLSMPYNVILLVTHQFDSTQLFPIICLFADYHLFGLLLGLLNQRLFSSTKRLN